MHTEEDEEPMDAELSTAQIESVELERYANEDFIVKSNRVESKIKSLAQELTYAENQLLYAAKQMLELNDKCNDICTLNFTPLQPQKKQLKTRQLKLLASIQILI